MTEEQFITIRQFAARLKRAGVREPHEKTVVRWCRQRVLDSRKVGRCWYIRDSEVRRVLEAGVQSLPGSAESVESV